MEHAHRVCVHFCGFQSRPVFQPLLTGLPSSTLVGNMFRCRSTQCAAPAARSSAAQVLAVHRCEPDQPKPCRCEPEGRGCTLHRLCPGGCGTEGRPPASSIRAREQHLPLPARSGAGNWQRPRAQLRWRGGARALFAALHRRRADQDDAVRSHPPPISVDGWMTGARSSSSSGGGGGSSSAAARRAAAAWRVSAVLVHPLRPTTAAHRDGAHYSHAALRRLHSPSDPTVTCHHHVDQDWSLHTFIESHRTAPNSPNPSCVCHCDAAQS